MDRVSLSLSLENKGRGPSPWTSGQVRAPTPTPGFDGPGFHRFGSWAQPQTQHRPSSPHSRNPKDLPLEPTTMDGRDGTGRGGAGTGTEHLKIDKTKIKKGKKSIRNKTRGMNE